MTKVNHAGNKPATARTGIQAGRFIYLGLTAGADTAKYLYEDLNPGNKEPDIDVIYGTDKSKSRMAGRFAPKANPQFKFLKGESEIHILVSTDVLSEGLNLQDGDKVVNYDLHWNPVKLIQRVGRIDRIGSENDIVWASFFLRLSLIEAWALPKYSKTAFKKYTTRLERMRLSLTQVSS